MARVGVFVCFCGANIADFVDVPAVVAKLTGPNAARDAVVARAEELMKTELLAMADDIAVNLKPAADMGMRTVWIRTDESVKRAADADLDHVHHQTDAVRLGNEVETLYTNGPAGGGGVTKSAREVIAIASTLIPRDAVRTGFESTS